MIKIRTLDTSKLPNGTADLLQQCIRPLRHTEIDVLCCQAVLHSKDRSQDTCSLVASTLNMSCGNFAASRQQPVGPPANVQAVSGLAMYTGAGVWVLNSGSFTVPMDSDGTEEIVQFGLLRKNGTSVLVLNLRLADGEQGMSQQLRGLFSHPLLRDPYGAVVLCADRQILLPAKELQAIVARSNYSLCAPQTAGASDAGLLCLLTARSEAVCEVSIRTAAEFQEEHAALPGLFLEFEVKRITPDKKNRPFFPLSFREQWLGYKEHRAFA